MKLPLRATKYTRQKNSDAEEIGQGTSAFRLTFYMFHVSVRPETGVPPFRARNIPGTRKMAQEEVIIGQGTMLQAEDKARKGGEMIILRGGGVIRTYSKHENIHKSQSVLTIVGSD